MSEFVIVIKKLGAIGSGEMTRNRFRLRPPIGEVLAEFFTGTNAFPGENGGPRALRDELVDVVPTSAPQDRPPKLQLKTSASSCTRERF